MAGKVRAAAPEQAEEQAEDTPLFDQWLASLKFVNGWNDQAQRNSEQVSKCLREHLEEEGIEDGPCVGKLCCSLVPLLTDLRKIDVMVVKNLKPEVLKGLKIVHVNILRIVTSELCRERAAKDVLKVSKVKAKQRAASQLSVSDVRDGMPYLVSNIDTLAQVVRHFRLDRNFSKGLHQLILSFRREKKATPQGAASSSLGGKEASSSKRKASASKADRSKSRDGRGAYKSAGATGRTESSPPRKQPRRGSSQA